MTLKRKKQEMAAKKKPMLEKASRLMVEDFEPRTENQKNCVISIAENVVTVITGIAGTGKSTIACGMASSYLCDNKVEKIFITRPMVQCGRKGGGIGFLTGDLMEKFLPYVTPLTLELERFLGKDAFRKYLMEGTIEILPIDLTRGRSLKDTFIIADEIQNTTEEQLDMLVTRIDHGSKMVLTGDLDQTDLPNNERGALEFFIEDVRGLSNVGICNLGIEDIQRHPIVGHIIAARNEGKKRRG
jgi:phosphate starvation-inducible PhoH-like protein